MSADSYFKGSIPTTWVLCPRMGSEFTRRVGTDRLDNVASRSYIKIHEDCWDSRTQEPPE